MKKNANLLLITILLLINYGCYSLKGISIDPAAKTFYVNTFENAAPNAPPTISNLVTESLNQKILRETRLNPSEENIDIEFSGKIRSFRVSSVAPQPGELSAFNRLTITYEVSYSNNMEGKEKENWTKNYTLFSDFSASQNLLDVQDDLIETIHQELMEKIFNDAFTNW